MSTNIIKISNTNTKKTIFFKSNGIVISSYDNIAQIKGLTLATSGEMIISFKGHIALILNLGTYLTGVITFQDNVYSSQDYVKRMFSILSTKINPYFLGNVFNPLGELLNKPNLLFSFDIVSLISELGIMFRTVEVKAPNIIMRQPIYESLFTGYLGVDGLLPLGQGQRELIIGDRQTGKTSLALDTALNQANIDSIIYYAIPNNLHYE